MDVRIGKEKDRPAIWQVTTLCDYLAFAYCCRRLLFFFFFGDLPSASKGGG